MFDVKIEWNGDEFLRKIERASNGDVPLGELCNSAFMRKYTEYKSIDEMATVSGLVEGNDEEQTVAIQSPAWDKWVAENTSFDSWQDMLNMAAVERVKKVIEG